MSTKMPHIACNYVIIATGDLQKWVFFLIAGKIRATLEQSDVLIEV